MGLFNSLLNLRKLEILKSSFVGLFVFYAFTRKMGLLDVIYTNFDYG